MDLSSPIGSVIPRAHGAVLAVLVSAACERCTVSIATTSRPPGSPNVRNLGRRWRAAGASRGPAWPPPDSAPTQPGRIAVERTVSPSLVRPEVGHTAGCLPIVWIAGEDSVNGRSGVARGRDGREQTGQLGLSAQSDAL